MYKFYKLIILFSIVALVSCGNKNTYNGKTISDVRMEPDTTIYVRLNSVIGDSLIDVSNIKTSRRDTFSIQDAKFAQKIYGEMHVGDTLAIMPLLSIHSIKSSYNLNEMVGLWLLKDGNGLNLTIDGMAISVGVLNDEISLRHWMIHNGRLLITYVLMDGSDYTERVDTSDITNLSNNELQLNINGKVYNCTHVKELISSNAKQ